MYPPKFLLAVFLACFCVISSVGFSSATSGPGCLRVVNIAVGDALNLRKAPTASSRVLASIIPAEQGILHLDGKCTPLSSPWKSRWCPVSYYSGSPNDPVKGWVKARYVRDNDCP